jgi:glycosyltransferase involved in cell wall biosynthesis
MKLLFVVAELPPIRTGDANHAFYMARQLAQRGIDVHVLTAPIEGLVPHPDFAVHPLMRDWSWRDGWRFRRFVKRTAPDAILLMYIDRMYSNQPMITFAPAIAKAVRPSLRFVTQIENLSIYQPSQRSFASRVVRKCMTFWSGREGISYQYGTLLRDSDALIFLSEMHRSKLAEQSPRVKEKGQLIPPPPIMTLSQDTDGSARARGRSLLGVGPDDFLLVFYGYVYASKGLETLLRALQTVAARQPQVRLIVVGDHPTHEGSEQLTMQYKNYVNQLRQSTHELGIADKVVWTGHCNAQDERASLYLRAADACVLPFDDGAHLNNSSLAAAACHGLPIITTESAHTEGVFLHQDNVFFCPPKDSQALAQAIETLMGRPDLHNRLHLGALQLAQEWFSWEKATDRTIAALRG